MCRAATEDCFFIISSSCVKRKNIISIIFKYLWKSFKVTSPFDENSKRNNK